VTTTLTSIDADVAVKPARAATDPNGPTGRLASWLADTTLDEVPSSVREHAKHLQLDGVARAACARHSWPGRGIVGVLNLGSMRKPITAISA
jgi:hypothetical protein